MEVGEAGGDVGVAAEKVDGIAVVGGMVVAVVAIQVVVLTAWVEGPGEDLLVVGVRGRAATVADDTCPILRAPGSQSHAVRLYLSSFLSSILFI